MQWDQTTSVAMSYRSPEVRRSFGVAEVPLAALYYAAAGLWTAFSVRTLLMRASTALTAPEVQARAFVSHLYSADSENHRRAVMVAYRRVDSWLTEHRFAYCEATLRVADVGRLSSEALLGLLTICAAAKENLPSYANFAERVRGKLAVSLPEHEVAEALRGLE